MVMFRRISFLVIVLSIALTLGLAAARGADVPATQATKVKFIGDPYFLPTDPVTAGPLGNKPIIYQYEGRELRFADQKSLETFKADPDAYLHKVDLRMIAQQGPFYPLNTCIISGDKLGGDAGAPVDIIYKNRLIRFCCDDCPKDFKKDPDKTIAKLNAAVIAKQAPSYPLSTCVISGDKLGGKPVDVVVGNRLVRFCCAGCQDDFNKNPAKYLKMIDEAAQKKTAK